MGKPKWQDRQKRPFLQKPKFYRTTVQSESIDLKSNPTYKPVRQFRLKLKFLTRRGICRLMPIETLPGGKLAAYCGKSRLVGFQSDLSSDLSRGQSRAKIHG